MDNINTIEFMLGKHIFRKNFEKSIYSHITSLGIDFKNEYDNLLYNMIHHSIGLYGEDNTMHMLISIINSHIKLERDGANIKLFKHLCFDDNGFKYTYTYTPLPHSECFKFIKYHDLSKNYDDDEFSIKNDLIGFTGYFSTMILDYNNYLGDEKMYMILYKLFAYTCEYITDNVKYVNELKVISDKIIKRTYH